MLQSRNTTFPRQRKKEKWGTNNGKIWNHLATEKPPWNPIPWLDLNFVHIVFWKNVFMACNVIWYIKRILLEFDKKYILQEDHISSENR